MRIAVEVDGAEISILAKEAVAKATPGEMLAAIVSGEALDAGAAAAPGETVGAETAAGQEVVAPAAAAGGLDAGPAPGAGSGEVSGQVEPVAPAREVARRLTPGRRSSRRRVKQRKERRSMEELFPIMTGLVIGGLLGLIRPSMRFWVGATLAVIFGVLATVISGEFRISWAFLLIDIPLVAGSAIAGLALMRRVRLGNWSLK